MLIASLALFAPGTFAESEKPSVLHVGMVAPDTIGITLQVGSVEYGKQVPYARHETDSIDHSSHHRAVHHKGVFLGWLVGLDQRLLYTEDRIVGSDFA
jgi:hypothetical protein